MNIFIISVYPFPNGFAATNRIISYSKGLIELGNKVTNLIVRPTEKGNSPNIEPYGIYDEINYYYTNRVTEWSENSIKKLFQFISGFFYSFFYLYKMNKQDKIDVIIVSIDNLFYDISYSVFLRKLLRTKVFFISDEYPKVLRNHLFLYKNFPFTLNIHQNLAYRYFDGIIVMTKALHNYFLKITNNIPIQLVLMTVEIERFERQKNFNITSNNYLAFLGDLKSEKDGLDILLKAFSIVSKIFPQYMLKIAGSTKNIEDIDKLKNLVSDLNINEKVEFIGKLKRDEVPDFLMNASLLLLSRPRTERSDGGFPTKLGEYLATSKPVVVTKVGEIPDYLEDGVNVFLAEPDSIESFTDKIIEALSDLDKAKKIGENGSKVAESVFNYKVQAKIMNEFLLNICRS